MDREQDQPPGQEPPPEAPTMASGEPAAEKAPHQWVPAATPSKGGRRRTIQRILLGAFISFVFLSVLYGVGQAAQLVALAVICTVGVGLIPITFVSWLVGWVLMEVWENVRPPRDAPSIS